jgi:hypothetical protein
MGITQSEPLILVALHLLARIHNDFDPEIINFDFLHHNDSDMITQLVVTLEKKSKKKRKIKERIYNFVFQRMGFYYIPK